MEEEKDEYEKYYLSDDYSDFRMKPNDYTKEELEFMDKETAFISRFYGYR